MEIPVTVMDSNNTSIVLMTMLQLQVDGSDLVLIQQRLRQCSAQNNWTDHRSVQIMSGLYQVIGLKGK